MLNLAILKSALVLTVFLMGSPAGASAPACTRDSSMSSVDDLASAVATLPSAQGAFDAWKAARERCKTASDAAQTECIEGCSSHMARGTQETNQRAEAYDPESTNNSSGQQAGNITNQAAHTEAARAACQSTKTGCDQACQAAKDAGQQLIGAANAAAAQCPNNPPEMRQTRECLPAAQRIQERVTADNRHSARGPTVGGKAGQCKGELNNNLNDMMKLLQELAKAIMEAMKRGDSSAASQAKTETPLDCSLPENQQKQECICRRDPRTPGCPNNLVKAGDGAAASNLAGQRVDLPGKESEIQGNLPPAGPTLPGAGVVNGGAGQGMLAGGGGGGPGGGGAGSGPESAEAGPAGSGLKADIYSGDGGGGGGGASTVWSSGGSSSARRGAASLGGKRAGGAGAPPQYVTGPGGRSNWEKVKIRYGENRPTFLSE